MNRPALTITNEKESEFEFDVSIQGVPAHEANVRFVIEDQHYDTTINCIRRDNDKWVARVPALHLTESAKTFHVEVIAGGYYFCPTKGTVKVISSPSVKIAEMVQHTAADRVVKVSATMTDTKTLVMMETMSADARQSVLKRCRAAGQIFSRAAGLMSEQRQITSHAIVDILEAVKKAIKMVEVKVYL